MVLKNVFRDIRFWLIFFFIVRLIGISNPPLEIGHNWRQCQTNMTTRNYCEDGLDILHPRIDWAGEKTGIVGSEFPFFNFLTYLAAKVFDYSHWLGRLVNLIVSSIGLYYFYRLVKLEVNEDTALYSTLFLTTSIWFAFSRKVMPDTFSMSLVISGLYYGRVYLQQGKNSAVALFFILSTLGVLSKIPALCLMSLIGVALILKVPRHRIVILYILAAISIAIVGWWYFVWVPHLLETYKYQVIFSKGFTEGLEEMLPYLSGLVERFSFSALKSFIGFACFLAGLYYFIKLKNKVAVLAFALVSVSFAVYMIKTGLAVPTHNYYIIPYVPVMALIAGSFIDKISNKKYQYALVALVCIEGIGNQQHDFFIKDSELFKLELETIVQDVVPKNDLIIINGGRSPQEIYFTNRKGWTCTNELLNTAGFLDSLEQLGAKYLILNKITNPDFQERNAPLVSGTSYDVYQLDL